MHKLSHQRAGVYSEVFEILITCIHLLRPACALKFGLLTIGLFIMQGYRMQLAIHLQASVHPTCHQRFQIDTLLFFQIIFPVSALYQLFDLQPR